MDDMITRTRRNRRKYLGAVLVAIGSGVAFAASATHAHDSLRMANQPAAATVIPNASIYTPRGFPTPSSHLQMGLRPPAASLHVGQTVTFWLTHNNFAGAAAFDLRLQGSWTQPSILTPDGTDSCGGDRVATVKPTQDGLWTLDFGSCGTVGIVLAPTAVGLHSLWVRTFLVPLDSTGMPLFRDKTLDKGNGLHWQGIATIASS